jgi:hypothetical protein
VSAEAFEPTLREVVKAEAQLGLADR